MSKCEFCKLVLDEQNPSRIGELSVSIAIVNLDQIYIGRCLVVLRNHLEDLTELSQFDRNLFTADMIKVAKAIKRAFSPKMMNYAILGNVQKHLHWHIIPRYPTDPNWGKSPWPHDRKYLREDEYKEIANRIRKHIE
jgi:diadenosine tetraphosphate (Ap4A) HIT family hydrolase